MGGRVLLLVAMAVLAVSGFLPWLRSGHRERTGFELIDAARTLHALDSTTVRVLALGMYLLPLAATLSWLALLTERPRTAAVIAVVAGLLGFLAALSIQRTPLPALIGVRAALIAAVVAIGGGLAELLSGRTSLERRHRERAHQPS